MVIGDNATQNKQRSLRKDVKDTPVGAIMLESNAWGRMRSGVKSDWNTGQSNVTQYMPAIQINIYLLLVVITTFILYEVVSLNSFQPITENAGIDVIEALCRSTKK